MLCWFFPAGGRRVELITLFKELGKVIVGDVAPIAPTLYFADEPILLPPMKDDRCLSFLIDTCKRKRVSAVIPLIDPEIVFLAKNKDVFSAESVMPIVSGLDSAEIGSDKLATYEFFRKIGIPTPRTALLEEHPSFIASTAFPLILKPRFGSAGQGIYVCADENELSFWADKLRGLDYILQEMLGGDEITIDGFSTGDGVLVQAVQRKRLKVRSGEVERAVTVKKPLLFEYMEHIAANLRPFGPFNVQVFSAGDRFGFTEINLRFGGGYPLAHRAGARFPELVRDLFLGRTIKTRVGNYQEGLYMLRYDSAVYTTCLVEDF
ncbi:MAG: ATP-grasp domain-containing protein [Bacillota bacterium]